MADELNWSGAFYESLAGSINRVTRGGPIGMVAGVVGEASAAMGGMRAPGQGPRTVASLAAAAGGGFILLNAGRSVAEAANAAGQGDYGSALTNAAIGVGWYAAGRLALGTLAQQLPVETGALAAYEKAAQARLAAEAKDQRIAQATVDSAKVANSNSVTTTAQGAALDAAKMAAEVVDKPSAVRDAAARVAAQNAAEMAKKMAATPSTVWDAAARVAVENATAMAARMAAGNATKQAIPPSEVVQPATVVQTRRQKRPRQYTLDLFGKRKGSLSPPPDVPLNQPPTGQLAFTFVPGRRGVQGNRLDPIPTPRYVGPRTGPFGALRSAVRRFLLISPTGRAIRPNLQAAGRFFAPAARVAGSLFSAGRRGLASGWQAAGNFAQMFYDATIRGKLF